MQLRQKRPCFAKFQIVHHFSTAVLNITLLPPALLNTREAGVIEEFETVSIIFTVNKATVNAKLAPVPPIFKVCTLLAFPTTCSTKNTNLQSVDSNGAVPTGFVTLKLLPEAGVNVMLFTLSKAN